MIWHINMLLIFFQTLPYDYYGEYGVEAHKDYPYRELLKKEYTFDFPEHHNQVTIIITLKS